jgi:hypothetical protein
VSGDTRQDVAIWRPDTGLWYILLSGSSGNYEAMQWGLPSDTPVPADYDGDGKQDVAVWRSGNGIWYILLSNSPGNYSAIQWGMNTDAAISPLAGILRTMP